VNELKLHKNLHSIEDSKKEERRSLALMLILIVKKWQGDMGKKLSLKKLVQKNWLTLAIQVMNFYKSLKITGRVGNGMILKD
jgi:hypothetical protein